MENEAKIVAWVVTERYHCDERGNSIDKPYMWDTEPVLEEDELEGYLYFRGGRVIVMPIGLMPTEPIEEDERIRFILQIDGNEEIAWNGNEKVTWKAFSTEEVADVWIASRKSR